MSAIPDRAEWLARQEAALLPVEYFHVVFTLPGELGPLCLRNQATLYGALFRAAADSVAELAADPKHLGAEVGCTAVLHTWGQALTLHPHVHLIVPGGGLSPDGSRWVSCRPGFFLPVRPLGRLFKGKYLAEFARLHKQGLLALPAGEEGLADPARFAGWLAGLREKDWVVYAKPPFGGPGQALKYLARYTHRVAISNHRLAAIDAEAGTVSFRWKDYSDSGTQKTMTLEGVEFLRRFVQHVPPSGFVRIRHFGLLANRHRAEKLALCRLLLSGNPSGGASPAEGREGGRQPEGTGVAGGDDARDPVCPACGRGRMAVIEVIPRPLPGGPAPVPIAHEALRSPGQAHRVRDGPDRSNPHKA